MYNNKIERIAVEVIKAQANQPSVYLHADIQEGDKKPSFDGEILVYKDESETTESLLGLVRVQVKGTQVECFSGESLSFSLDMAHYKNYYQEQGILLFVVELLANYEAKIFYKPLLALELKNIIESKQKSKTMILHPLQDTSLYEVCLKFMEEKKSQPLMLVEKTFDISNFNIFQSRSVTFIPEKHSPDQIFKHNFTLYGELVELDVPLLSFNVKEILLTEGDYIYLDLELSS